MYFYLELKCDSSLNVISFIPFAIYMQLLWAIFFLSFFNLGKEDILGSCHWQQFFLFLLLLFYGMVTEF